MEELLASQTKKLITPFRGQQIEGEVLSILEKEVILDLGAKSEGVLQKRELTDEKLQNLKLGEKLSVFVVQTENESGQIAVSLHKALDLRGDRGRGRGGNSRTIAWSKFSQAQSQKAKLQATVLEVNKGGLIVEVEGVRGFLPNSQVGFELLSKSGQGLDKLIGQTLALTVIEVDQNNNKLIFSQRGQVSEEVLNKLKGFKKDEKVKGKVAAILPFGLVMDLDGVEGLVFISDASWEKVEDLSKDFSVGQEVEALVLGIDEGFGRLNLSIKQLKNDPFSKITEKYPADEVIKAEVLSVSEDGVRFKLEGVEGVLPASKTAGETYEVGKSYTVLVDSVDSKKRVVNLAPFVTSTSGLIYK